MSRKRWAAAGTVASGETSGTLPIDEYVNNVRVSVRPADTVTVHSTNVPVGDIVAGSWEEWEAGAVTVDTSDVVFGATAILITATDDDCDYNLTGW